MTFKERLFICPAGHRVRSWQWNNVDAVPCGVGCGDFAERAIVGTGRNAQNAQPFVYYERPNDGDIFVAATAADTRAPKGYQRREIKTMREYSRFQRERRERDRGRSECFRERDKLELQASHREGRERLEAMMSNLTAEGQALARAAIESSMRDEPPAVERDCFVQGFEMDRGERPGWNDESTDWRRRD